jgi:hypothetical protein
LIWRKEIFLAKWQFSTLLATHSSVESLDLLIYWKNISHKFCSFCFSSQKEKSFRTKFEKNIFCSVIFSTKGLHDLTIFVHNIWHLFKFMLYHPSA